MSAKKFCVIGLGHFGYNLALRLSEEGAEVLAIDNHQDKIDSLSDKVTHAICMDSTDARSMASLGLKDMDACIVAIGEGFESSLLTSAILQELGVKNIYNRIISPIHERLLKLMNITNLLVPEAEAAEHLARRLMIPGLIEAFHISKEFGIFEIKAPSFFVNKTIFEINLRQTYSLNLVTIKRTVQKSIPFLSKKEELEVLGVPDPNTIILEGDILVLFGKQKDVRNLLEE